MEQFRKVNYTKDWSAAIKEYLKNNLNKLLKKFNLDNFKVNEISSTLSIISFEDAKTGIKVFFNWYNYFWPLSVSFPYYYYDDILNRQNSDDTSLPYNSEWAKQYMQLDKEIGLEWEEYFINVNTPSKIVRFKFPNIDSLENTVILRTVYILIKGLTKINKMIKSQSAFIQDLSTKTKPEKFNSLISKIQIPSKWHSEDLEKMFIDPGENLCAPKITID